MTTNDSKPPQKVLGMYAAIAVPAIFLLNILRENIFMLHELAKYLHDEIITGDEFMEILSKKPKEAAHAVSD